MTHAPTAEPPLRDAAPATILIVDDEPAQMKALCNTLRDQGYVTVGFVSAGEALTALRGRRFDLLLTDLSMPEMDGISLLQAAREIDGELVGIMMTGHGAVDTAVQAMKAGALDYILKPFKLSNIMPVLSRAMAVRRLREENAELARRVHERTDQLEAANHELEAFSYSIAHDLRAPLRSIDGFASILFEDFAPHWPAEAQRLLGTVSERAQHMGRLIDALLRLSRLGRQPLSLERVPMTTLARQVLDELRAEQPERRLETIVADLPDAVGDVALLRQVLVNLLSNAFKFTRQRPDAHVDVGFREDEGERIYHVRDNGAGFDMRFAERLFGVFQRQHRADEFEGTGVGLSIVQRIIRRHGGRVWAEAEVDKGATFFFTLPTAPS